MFIGILARSRGNGGGGGWSPKDLSGILNYYRSWEGVVMSDATTVDYLDDLIEGGTAKRSSGEWWASGGAKIPPQIDGIDAIGGVTALRLDGDSFMKIPTLAITYPDSSEGGFFVVYKITDAAGLGGTYGALMVQNATQQTDWGAGLILLDYHNSPDMYSYHGYNADYNSTITATAQLDESLVIVRHRTGEEDFYLNGTETHKVSGGTDQAFDGAKLCYLGNALSGRGVKMLVCEFGFIGDMTDEEVVLMETYVNETYGI